MFIILHTRVTKSSSFFNLERSCFPHIHENADPDVNNCKNQAAVPLLSISRSGLTNDTLTGIQDYNYIINLEIIVLSLLSFIYTIFTK